MADFKIDGPGMFATEDDILVEIVGKSVYMRNSEWIGVYRDEKAIGWDFFDEHGSGDDGLQLTRKCG